MATGDPICPTCGQWQIWCVCGHRPPYLYFPSRLPANMAAPFTSGYVQRADAPPNPPSRTTTTAKPGDPPIWLDPTWATTVTTTTTYKPRKRRHYRQVVY
jgi:hypothetical protein